MRGDTGATSGDGTSNDRGGGVLALVLPPLLHHCVQRRWRHTNFWASPLVSFGDLLAFGGVAA